MSKIKNNKINTNQTKVDVLKQNIRGKIDSQDELVRVHNLYGLFLSDNTFVVAEEESDQNVCCVAYDIKNFFTESLITWRILDSISERTTLPWKNQETFSIGDNLEAIAFPIRIFLDKYIKYGVTTKRNITVLLDITNEYIKEHPTFVDDMFKEMEATKHI